MKNDTNYIKFMSKKNKKQENIDVKKAVAKIYKIC